MSNTIIDLISSISALTELDLDKTCKFSLLCSSVSNQQCRKCQQSSYENKIIKDQISKVQTKYNDLLSQTKRLIDLYYQLFEEHQNNFQQTVNQLHEDKEQLQRKNSQLESVVQQNNRMLGQYRNLLLEKDESIMALEDKIDNFNNLNVLPCPQMQFLKHHRKQKSQLCNKLQISNHNLAIQNQNLKQQNSKIANKMNQLKQYVQRMEQDLAHNNIKSPRIIHQFIQCEDTKVAHFADAPAKQKDECSIDQCSLSGTSQQCSSQLFNKKLQHRKKQSIRSSFIQSRKPLRQILDFSGETNKYFNFRTKQKLDCLSQKFVSNQNFNSCNIPTQQVNECHKIMQIKQFQVVQIQQNIQNKNANQTVEKNKSYAVQINNPPPPDPYYNFFVLTTQCVKLNWRNLNEVANIDLTNQWNILLNNKIPINKWSQHLTKYLANSTKQQNDIKFL